MRTCIGCRATRPQADLVRCALDAGGRPTISRTAPGRGAWLCSAACCATAVRRRAFDRAWRRRVDDAALAELASAFESASENMRHLSVAGQGPGAPTPTKG